MKYFMAGAAADRSVFSGAVAALLFFSISACAAQGTQARPSPAKSAKPANRPLSSAMSHANINAITAHHQKVRRDVGVGPLKWSATLAAYAQTWADQLASTSCKMKHRTEGKYGENLYMGTAGHYTAIDAAKAWESEKSLYAGGILTRKNFHPTGHYTQMVWRNTRTLGCGESICNGMLIVACNYDPPGNYVGQSPY